MTMSELAQVLGVIGLIISVPTSVGAALALIRASYTKAQLEQVRKFNTDLTEYNNDLQRQVDVLKRDVTSLKNERDIAVEMVTQRADLESHHREDVESHRMIIETLHKLIELVEKVVEHGGTT